MIRRLLFSAVLVLGDQRTLKAPWRLHREHAPLFAFNTTGPVVRSGECKVFPGDDGWPSQEEWDALDSVLGGALIKSVPIAAPCYRDWGRYDAEECRALLGNWTNPDTQ
ncbi:hypothetical protein ESCO_003775 [Escovopsis weberi]|uniref:Uncharacterized protein n=1 Tax=Escovopsis weberi TaxID=150374 RepID=A0A0M9VXH4_ESCWE|nr:hypothetical protein ESCO_003775 [Escovopsis weberi]